MLQLATSAGTVRRPWRDPDEHARLGAEVLGLAHLKPRARLKAKQGLRYGWFAGRNRTLAAVGRVAEKNGPIAARMCADAVLVRLDQGVGLTTAEAAYVVREAACRLADVGPVTGTRGRA